MPFELTLWFLPMFASFLWNLAFYIKILRTVFSLFSPKGWSDYSDTDNSIRRAVIRRLSSLLLVFVICWTLDVYNHFSEYIVKECPPQWYYVIQSALYSFQGLLSSIVYFTASPQYYSNVQIMFFGGKRQTEEEDWLLD